MMHRMYACVRTYGYVGAMYTRLVVECVNEHDLSVNRRVIRVNGAIHALIRVSLWLREYSPIHVRVFGSTWNIRYIQ